MAYQRYSSYQYETSPKKMQPEYEPKKNPKKKSKVSTKKKVDDKKEVKKEQQPKLQIKDKAKLIFAVLLGFSLLFVISYRNSQITEKFNQKEDLKAELALLQKENEQLEVNIENSLNLNNIEQLAKEKLGMQKLSNNQKVYVSLEKKDYIEPAVEEVIIENETSIWERIMEILSNII